MHFLRICLQCSYQMILLPRLHQLIYSCGTVTSHICYLIMDTKQDKNRKQLTHYINKKYKTCMQDLTECTLGIPMLPFGALCIFLSMHTPHLALRYCMFFNKQLNNSTVLSIINMDDFIFTNIQTYLYLWFSFISLIW